MKILSFAIAFLLLSAQLSAQKIFVNGQEGNRLLEWKDFEGKPDASSAFYALTWWTLGYRYDNVTFKGNEAVLENMQVKLEFDGKKSWRKKGKETDALLQHEQGHFNIGILCLREIMESIDKAKLRKDNYNEVIKNIFSESLKKYHTLDAVYDRETNHSSITAEQERWNLFINSSLQKE